MEVIATRSFGVNRLSHLNNNSCTGLYRSLTFDLVRKPSVVVDKRPLLEYNYGVLHKGKKSLPDPE